MTTREDGPQEAEAASTAYEQLVSYRMCGPAPGRRSRAYDELLDARGAPRAAWAEAAAALAECGAEGPAGLARRVRGLIEDEGITCGTAGSGRDAGPWRLDPIPLLVSAADWSGLESGLAQRSLVLDELLTDVYGPRRTLGSGLLPPEIVFGHRGYVPAAHGITVPGRRQLFLHACDVSRWGDGRFRVIADRTQVPSGLGYALAARRVLSRAVPRAFEHADPRSPTPFTRAMRSALIDSAHDGDEEPVVVVLTPGARAETAFDHANLAAALGFPLVESADLVVRDGALWMRSLGTLRRVDVVLRRVDAEYCDPLDLRPDSRLGVVGLVEALRRGAVTAVNTLGSGLLENPALPGFLPKVARALLDEDLTLESIPSYWGGDTAERAHLLANLHKLVIRSTVDGSARDGAQCSRAERAELRARIDAQGWQWVGQEPAEFSVAPALPGAGETAGLVAEPVGMRLFSLAGSGGYTVMPGALGRRGGRFPPGRAVVEVAAKDVWVRAVPASPVAAAPGRERRAPRRTPREPSVGSPRVLDDLFWIGRYGERAEAVVRLLIATDARYQESRRRTRQEGADALPILLGATARVTATAAPLGMTDSARIPVRQQQSIRRGDVAATATGTGAADVHDYLVALTLDRELPGSLAFSIGGYAEVARAVRDRLSVDTWRVLGAAERALAEHPARADLAQVRARTLAALLALSGIGAESLVRDTGWHVMDIGKRLERGLGVTALLSSAFAVEHPEETERAVTESVLRATESSVTYARRHHDAARLAYVAELLLFDTGNPRSLVYQLDRLDAGLRALPGPSSSRPRRLLADAQRMVRRIDPDDLEATDREGARTEWAALLEGVHLRLSKLAEAFEAARLSSPQGIQPLPGGTGVAG